MSVYIDKLPTSCECCPCNDDDYRCGASGEIFDDLYDMGRMKSCPLKSVKDLDDDAGEKSNGEWQITDAYPHNVYCSVCHKKFAQTHWVVWEDGSLPRNYCPNCGARMENKNDIS